MRAVTCTTFETDASVFVRERSINEPWKWIYPKNTADVRFCWEAFCVAYHLEMNFSIVFIHRAVKGAFVGSWELFSLYLDEVLYALKHVQFLVWQILLEASCKVVHSDSCLFFCLFDFSFKTIKSWLWPSSILSIHDINPSLAVAQPPSCPDPTVHLKLLTSSTANSIGGVLSAKKK